MALRRINRVLIRDVAHGGVNMGSFRPRCWCCMGPTVQVKVLYGQGLFSGFFTKLGFL